MNNAHSWIRKLKLKKHPEGGYYCELYRSAESIPGKALPRRYKGRRSFSTSIYFLLKGRDISRFHRLKSDETWHFHTGSSLTIHVISPKGKYSEIKLGCDPKKKQALQYTVSRNHWFGATVHNPKGFSLVGCTVSPGFDFADFELADQEELLARFPHLARIIRKLTTQTN